MKLKMTKLAVALLLAISATGCTSSGLAQVSHGTEAQRARLQIAETMFQERCKTAGEKIHRTVENVEGIFLVKVRPSEINYSHQFVMDDPYGRDLGGDGYIESFIVGEYQATHKGTPWPGSPTYLGYGYVEANDLKDGQRYRYTSPN